MEKEQDRYSSNALIRGLKILKLFNANEPRLSLPEIAQKLGVNRSVPFRLLKTLENFGYIVQDEQTKKYQLAPKVLELGFAYLSSIQLPEIVQPYLEQLRDEIGASVYLSLLDDFEVVYVAQARTKEYQGIFVNTGIRLPAHATAPGKVLLAFKSSDELKELLQDNDLRPYTKQTITNSSKLEAELQITRQQGFSTSSNELQEGIGSIAVPLFNNKGEVVAAINIVAADTYLSSKDVTKSIITLLLKKTEEISKLLH